jgi:hypothetical protein
MAYEDLGIDGTHVPNWQTSNRRQPPKVINDAVW